MKITTRHICALLIGALSLIWLATATQAATLLPPGKNCFFTPNGVPNASGTVSFYIPNTLSPKDTYTDADATVLNTNPVVLDASGCSVIYGIGAYRQILKDSVGVTIWDQPTSAGHALDESWSGTSTGSANAQVITNGEYNQIDGDLVYFVAGFSNVGPMTLTVNGYSALPVVRDGGSGPVLLAGGEVVAGNVIGAIYVQSTGQFHLITPTPIQSFDAAIYFAGVITPTILAADQNDWTPTGGFSGANTVRVSATTPIIITGMTGGASGRTIFMHNVGSSAITFTSGSTASLAANRFNFGAPVVLLPNMAVTFQYDSTSTVWRQINPTVTVPMGGSFSNLTLTNGATPNTQLIGTANAFTLQDASGNVVRRTSLSCTADGAVSGAGGLDTGSFTVSTWYSYWFIYNPATNADSCIISTQSAFGSLTLPSGYTFAARAGWNRTIAGAAQFNRVTQKNKRAQYVVSASVTTSLPLVAGGTATVGTYSTTAPVYATASISNFVPTTASVIHITWTNAYDGVARSMVAAPNATYAGPASSNAPPISAISSGIASGSASWVLESTNVYIANSGNGGALLAEGWDDNL